MIGGIGDDTLIGGTGIDTAVFSGSFDHYDFSTATGGFNVAHARGTMADGTDFVSNDIEVLTFADLTIDDTTTDPVARDDSDSTLETQILSGSSVLSNDFDFQALKGSETLTVSAVNGSPLNVGTQLTLASGALLTVNADGTYQYDPNGQFDSLAPGQTATDSFSYTVSDGQGGLDTATATITVNGENTAPDLSAGASAQLNLLNVLQLTIDPTINIIDPDDTQLVGAQVQITSGFSSGDTLIFTDQNGISGSYNSGNGTLTLSGTASIADYEAALESVQFQPGLALVDILQVTLGQREFTFIVNDGDVNSAPTAQSTALIDVVLV